MIEADSRWLDSLLPYGDCGALNLYGGRAAVSNLAEPCWRPEREGELWAGKTWLLSWQWFRWSPDMHPVSHRGEDQRRGTWRATAAARRRWDLSGRPTAGGTASVAATRAQVDRTPRFLLSRAYPMAMAHESRWEVINGDGRPATSRGVELGSFSVGHLLYHGDLLLDELTEHFEA